jgi:hypothetical protein
MIPGRGGGQEGPQKNTTLARVSSIAMVGQVDRDSPPIDVLQPPYPATSDAEGQDLGISGIQLPRPSFPQIVE